MHRQKPDEQARLADGAIRAELGEPVSRRTVLRVGSVLAGTAVAGGMVGAWRPFSTSAAATSSSIPPELMSLSDMTVGVASPVEVEILREFYDTMRRQAELDSNGEKITVVDAQGDSARQHTQVDAFIAQQFDAIVLLVLTADGWEEQVARATEDGIGVFNHSASAIEGCTQNVGLDQYGGGYGVGEAAAAWINENHGGAAEVGLLSILNDPQLRLRTEGFKDALAEFAPDATIAGEANAQTRDEGAAGAANLLQAHPEIKVIYAAGDDPGLGAYTSATEAGKSDPQQFFIGSSDGTEPVFELIDEAGIYQCTWSFLFPLSATQFQRDIESFLRGDAVRPTRIVSGQLVTADNLADLRDLFADPQAPEVQDVYSERMRYSDYQLMTNEPFANAFEEP